jgi:hypothetical protein
LIENDTLFSVEGGVFIILDSFEMGGDDLQYVKAMVI